MSIYFSIRPWHRRSNQSRGQATQAAAELLRDFSSSKPWCWLRWGLDDFINPTTACSSGIFGIIMYHRLIIVHFIVLSYSPLLAKDDEEWVFIKNFHREKEPPKVSQPAARPDRSWPQVPPALAPWSALEVPCFRSSRHPGIQVKKTPLDSAMFKWWNRIDSNHQQQNIAFYMCLSTNIQYSTKNIVDHVSSTNIQ